MIRTDLDRLVQVFINLITNAKKYCRADAPALTILVGRRSDGITVDFVDNGEGIPADAQAVIFEKFYRATGAEGDGAGLGLAICREIMHRLDGEISYLTSYDGAAFRVYLPASALASAQTDQSELTQPA